jgi:hypothetical protein
MIYKIKYAVDLHYNLPMTLVNNSGAEPPAAIIVAPATSSEIFIFVVKT